MQKLKDIIKVVLYHAGYYPLIKFHDDRRGTKKRLLILTYHNISDGREFFLKEHPFKVRPVITATQFETHLLVLKQNFFVLSLKDAVYEIKKNKEPKKDLVAITFDDGYRSFYHLAFPLLKKYNLPATVFLPTDFINRKMIFWWDKLSRMFFFDNIKKVSRSILRHLIGEKLTENFFDTKKDSKRKISFLAELESYLVGLEDGLIEEKVKELQDIFCSEKEMDIFDEALPLTWKQIKELSEFNIEFGSHTCSHLNLKNASLQKIEKEIVSSKEEIESQTGSQVNCFAYPYGADLQTYKKIKPILARHHFICACSALPGINDKDTDPYLLRREFLPWTNSVALTKRELILGFAHGNKIPKKQIDTKVRNAYASSISLHTPHPNPLPQGERELYKLSLP
jgi:peptidoglycan/xylan/chitin deacetylase (PgdA/CDA1 family)